jgi:alpha-galactosidase
MKTILLKTQLIKKNFATFMLLLLLVSNNAYGQKFEKLALTPPMGWNSWNKFACNVNEKLIRETADAMVSSGMKDAGYQYIVIDDCWHGKRDSLGFIHPDPERFPSGMKALADYIHSKGLKFGIYSDAGWQTCGSRPGSRGYEYQDAMMYAGWGVDYLKYDWCNTEGLNTEGAYLTMRNALYAAGRPIVFSLCEWGNSQPWKWGKNIGHLWRTTGDIYPCFDCKVDHGTWFSWGVMYILDMQKGLRDYAGPDHWNDPDMMEVGNGMSVNEDRAHFSMWCMLAAPLIAGNDISNMSKETKEILTNKDVIAVNQDSLGIQGIKYSSKDSVEIWFKPLVNDDWAICILNRSKKPQNISFDWKSEVVSDSLFGKDANFDKTVYSIRDLWTKKLLGVTKKVLKSEVSGHDVLMIRLKKM